MANVLDKHLFGQLNVERKILVRVAKSPTGQWDDYVIFDFDPVNQVATMKGWGKGNKTVFVGADRDLRFRDAQMLMQNLLEAHGFFDMDCVTLDLTR